MRIGQVFGASFVLASFCAISSSAQPSSQIFRQKIERLKARSPENEARLAAARGDSRLAGTNHIGPMPSGWDVPGVACTFWTRDAIGKWYVSDDVINSNDEVDHGARAYRFVTLYNQALVEAPGFRYPEICARSAKRLKAQYGGVITSYGDAVRSADPSKLDQVPTGASLNQRDLLGYTPLNWALYRRDGEMARLLIERGSDVTLRAPSSGSDFDGPAPLALALMAKSRILVDAMRARGAGFQGWTGLCEDERDPNMMLAPQCYWLTLAIEAGREDLIEPVVREQSATELGRDAVQGDIALAFQRALDRRQDKIIARLLPLLSSRDPSTWVYVLLNAGRFDLAQNYVRLHADELGNSRAESTLWAAAAEAGQADALSFLAHYGGELNLLTSARLSACRAAVARGDIDALTSCVREASDRRLEFERRIKAGDEAGFLTLVREAADAREYRRATLADLAADHGTASTVRKLAPLIAPLRLGLGAERQKKYPDARFSGIASWTGLPQLKTRLDSFSDVVAKATARKDVELVASLAALRPTGMGSALTGYMNGIVPRISMDPLEDPTTESLPNAPDVASMAIVRSLIAMSAAGDGPQSLEDASFMAVQSGWNDVLNAIFAAGLKGSQLKRPDRFWQAWAGLSSACKPSTGSLLLAQNVRIDYPLDPHLNGEPPLWIVAAACKNPASAELLVKAGADVNYVAGGGGGRTLVEEAQRRGRTRMAEALRQLGGLTSDQLPQGVASKRAAQRADIDWDLVPTEEVR